MIFRFRALSIHGSKVLAGRIYSAVNREFFKGTLPDAKFHIIDNGAYATAERRTHFASDGRTIQREHAVICIHPYLAVDAKLLTRELLHEIVHIAWPRLSHGVEFERRMVRIRGACIPDQLF